MSLFGGGRRPALYLHIGLPQAGARTLQRVFTERRAALREAGVLYAATGSDGNAHHPFARLFGFADPLERGAPAARAPAAATDAGAMVDALRAEIHAAPGAIGLLSSELWSHAGQHARLVEALQPHFDLGVIVHLRRHDLWLPLVYDRAVRDTPVPRWGRTYEAYLKFLQQRPDALPRFRDLVETWARLVGRERVRVRPFEAAQVGPNPAHDLLRTIGATQAALAAIPADVPDLDRPLSYEGLCLLDIVRHAALPREAQDELAARILADDPGGDVSTPLASAGLRAGHIAAHFDDYEYIAHRYLGRRDGQLFLETTPSDEQPQRKPPAHPTFMWVAERLCRYIARSSDPVLEALRQDPMDTRPTPHAPG